MSSVAFFINTKNKTTKCSKTTPLPPRFGDKNPGALFVKALSGKTLLKSTSSTSKVREKDDRSDCAICKKYSKGPCGTVFTEWLKCIDTNDSEKSNCDDLVLALDKCLKKNEKYYQNVFLYEDESENNERTWKLFVAELESDDNEQEVAVEQFPKLITPLMQYRMMDRTGIIMFHPRYSKNGSEQLLILGYIKDQNNIVLAGAASEEFVEYKGMKMLRFQTAKDSRDVKACAIYMESERESKEEEEIIIYQRVERIPLHTN